MIKEKNVICHVIKKIPEYYQDGYLSLGVDYLRNHGLKQTLKKTKQILIKEKIRPISLTVDGEKKLIRLVGRQLVIPQHQISVDIIICVHNAFDDIKRCIDSILNYTSEPYHIIIVDDGSLEDTREYLKMICEQYQEKTTLLRNEKGHGYAIAANIGLRQSKADYKVLLNSDTIVTRGWLDRMLDCIESDEEIGIVGPLSNTASWQSVPILEAGGDWCHNQLPANVTISEMGQWIEVYSGNIYPQVPLINGFCMMISKVVIDKIGIFDEENFGKGFGEEDDFNLRAQKAGFKLAVADNVYIYHAQSKSYSDEKRKQLCEISGLKVREKHGSDYLDQCITFMKDNLVLEGSRCRVAAMLERMQLVQAAQEKWHGKAILFHLPCAESGGGANVVIQEAERMLDMGIQVSIYNLEVNKECFSASYPNLKIPVLYGKDYAGFTTYIQNFDVICLTYYKAVKYCHELIEKYPAVKIAYYIQDFEPFFFKKGSRPYQEALKSYTEIPEMICLTKTKWNYDVVKSKTGKECHILGPSVNLDLFRPRKAFGNRELIHVAAMVRPSSPRRAPEETMIILQKLYMKYGAKIKIFIFGCDSQEYSDFFKEFKNCFEYENMGVIGPQCIAALLSEMDIFADFSTFQAMGLTAMEAMASGCAVLLPQNGGTISFAEKNKNCIVVDTTSQKICVEQMSRLIEDGELRHRLANNAVSDMCQYYPERCTYRMLECFFS